MGFALTPSTVAMSASRAAASESAGGTCAQKMMLPGSCSTKFHDFDGARLLRLDERAVQPARGLDGHHLAERVHRDRIGVRAGHGVVERGDELRVRRRDER